jgi:S-adenosyl-L-methionine hydrolase (adenosine-forming)
MKTTRTLQISALLRYNMLITLTTDLGTRDWYAGVLKGAIMRAAPSACLIDISHEVRPYDIVQAALVLRNACPEFPEDTLHLVAVNCVYGADARFVAVRHGGHLFFAPDNGLLTLLPDTDAWTEVRLLPHDTQGGGSQGGHFNVKNIYAAGVAHLANGGSWDTLGTPLEQPLQRRISLQPVITANHIRGTVVYIDRFDNVVLNITKTTFEQAQRGRAFSLYFKRNDPLTTLHVNYSDVALGEPLCLFNSAGLLEIAINFGRAATLLGLKEEDVVEVIFEAKT